MDREILCRKLNRHSVEFMNVLAPLGPRKPLINCNFNDLAIAVPLPTCWIIQLTSANEHENMIAVTFPRVSLDWINAVHRAGTLRDGLYPSPNAASNAVTQKSVSMVLESFQASTCRLCQSMMATRYRKP